MAINIKNIITNGLLELNKDKSLESITVKQLLEKTGVSRQTFYNHFMDKNDLIQYVYNTKIIPDFNDENKNIKFYESLLIAFQNMKQYHKFMKEACMIDGQNCLKDYIFQHCKEFDLKWHQKLYGETIMPEALRFATEYHATASTSMTLSWILSDMPVSCEDIALMITKMRGIGMEKLFEDGENKGNPYE